MARRYFRPLVVPIACISFSLASLAGCGSRPPPDPCFGPYPYSVTHEEIAAAARLAFDPSKAEALGRIAARPGLAPHEQQHLVVTALTGLAFDPHRVEVLTKLINNPAFAPPAKACILRHLDRIAFDPSRADLLKAMDGRGDVAPGPDTGEAGSRDRSDKPNRVG